MYRNASYTPRRYDGQAYSPAARRNLSQPMPSNRPTPNSHPRWIAFTQVQPARAAWIQAKAPSFDFAGDMMSAVVRFGDLTERQGAAVDRCIARDQDRAQQAAQPRQTVSAEFPNIRAAFDTVVSGGARRASITIGEINLSLAPMTGANPGALYVKVNGQYAGKIVGTAFRPGRDAPATLTAMLTVIEADPRAAIQQHAEGIAARLAAAAARGEALSLPCGCCGITLTDPVSIARGIGPICAAKWGF